MELRPENGTTEAEWQPDEGLKIRWAYLFLIVVPVICVLGNILVIAAVVRTKSLHTPTNYLLVSLALADLTVGLFAMPFSIYLSVNDLHWHLSPVICQFYCTVDVAASTSSIIHLVLISIDSIFSPFTGTNLNTDTQQILLRDHFCGIYSPIYMFCSSIFAFYLPCFIMIITYGYIFHILRNRLRTIRLREMTGGQLFGLGADVGNITEAASHRDDHNRNIITWEKPFLRKIEETAMEHANSLNDSDREQLRTIFDVQHLVSPCPDRKIPLMAMMRTRKAAIPDLEVRRNHSTSVYERSNRSHSEMLKVLGASNGSSLCDDDGLPSESSNLINRRAISFSENSLQFPPIKKDCFQMNYDRMRRLSSIITEWNQGDRTPDLDFNHSYSLIHRESFYVAKRKLAGLKNWALSLVARLRLRQGVAIRREKRATKLVAVVMGVFLICWLPFFTLNMIKVYKLMNGSWSSSFESWFHWFTALGYLNSSLNFFIYFAINKKFRSSLCRMFNSYDRKKIHFTQNNNIHFTNRTRPIISHYHMNAILKRRNGAALNSRTPKIIISEPTTIREASTLTKHMSRTPTDDNHQKMTNGMPKEAKILSDLEICYQNLNKPEIQDSCMDEFFAIVRSSEEETLV